MSSANPLSEDLGNILDQTREMWDEVRGKKIFITGGTGFFGCWLLESFLWANEKLGLNASAVVLTRNFDRFKSKIPRLAEHPALSFVVSDVNSFEFSNGDFSHVIHAATDVYQESSPLKTIETTVAGTRRALDFAVKCGAKKFLLTSSGAVYGVQPPSMPQLREDYTGAPDVMNPSAAYGEGKRLSEFLCAAYAREYEIETKIARSFAVVGPYLRLGGHLAIENFIKDSLEGKPIRVNSDGTTLRSYLYAADLTAWLWTILFRGKSCRPYNVGSDEAISVARLAETISALSPRAVDVEIAEKPGASLPARYVPSIERARQDLGLQIMVDLESAIQKTLNYYKR